MERQPSQVAKQTVFTSGKPYPLLDLDEACLCRGGGNTILEA
jgi:hypothetical protein